MDKFTIDELEQELLGRYGDILGTIIDPELEKKIFQEMKAIDGLTNYLQALMNKDIVRYFSAQEENARDLTRGAFLRTLHFKKKMKAKPKLDKTDNKRYK